MANITFAEIKAIKELLDDAKDCHRLTQWEQEFVADISKIMDAYGDRLLLSDAQKLALKRIEAKVYV